MNRKINRRNALLTSMAAGALMVHGGAGRRLSAAESPNEKLNLACIGVGGRGAANVSGVKSQNMVAFVDVDAKRAGKTFESFPNVQQLTDYRKLFDQFGSKLDGVVISTPDHTHFHPAYAAMQLGINVYLEKPLAHNVWETRTLTELARSKGLATQLGSQRHAMSNMHRVVEWVQSGAIGEVQEVHSWVGGSRGMPDFPTDNPPVPPELNYDLWRGPVLNPPRPYHPTICPYGWRFWWDFGTGETGNWGCHILDIPYWSLQLTKPTRIKASGPEPDAERTPKAMHVEYQFPAIDDHATLGKRGAVKLHWYHGTPPILKEKGLDASGNNTLMIGSKGMLLCGFSKRQLLPEDQFADYKSPDEFIPDSPGFHNEWLNACRGGEAATCNFDYSGPMAETVLLGNVAYRAGNFDWDAEALSTGDNQAAQALIKEAYRPGWEIEQS
ncbi:putative oxidoreductase YdgJ [Roseimaritima multifibrata]|uniref:Putative oxidoreductase YdgJ n=1 Tax=Roseimaritima multifibrata TaxID=1930274 RepID=A0A517MCF9_9BACT|nr:Gfo/Idh/MocA family oxidoreductase [Roseimaritima multifibrata]QDS92561.1 putative oxidoreductase YdgJ [Roseimaritima multifibrata]